MLRNYLKHRKLVEEIEYYDDETIKYLESEPEETIAKRVKLNPGNKTRTGLKISSPSILLPRFPVSLAQIKAGKDSDKLKNEIKQILYFSINTIKSLKIVAKVLSNYYNNEQKYGCNKRNQNFFSLILICLKMLRI